MLRRRRSSWRSASKVEAVADTTGNVTPRTLGQRLAAERERQGLSRADVAQRLHMSAYQVEAIETGDYTRLPQGTFLRGFVRNYAKVLGMPADELLAMLTDGAAAAKRPGIVVPTESIRFDPLGQRLDNPYVKAIVIAFVLVSLGFAGMYWWLFVRPAPHGAATPKPATQVQAPAPQPASRAETVAVAPVTALPPAPAPAPAKAEAKKAEPPKVEPPKAEPPKVVNAAQGSTLKFVFKGSSWVEVRDAKGKLLFSRLNAPGSDAEVSGKPPFNVIVGNAPEVQLYYNDHEFDLEPHTKVAVARFTVE